MRLVCLAFLLGVLLLHQHTSLPSPYLALFIFPLLLLLKYRAVRPFSVMACGYLWALATASWYLHLALPANVISKDAEVVGVIASIPALEDRRLQFYFKIEEMEFQGQSIPSPGLVKLSWYNEAPTMKLGQRWRLTVRLKPPHGFRNPGGFDYEQWLFSEKIRALGYVRENASNALLAPSTPLTRLAQMRQSIADEVAARATDLQHESIIAALTIGDRQEMSDEQWRVLLVTGTNHLMAISGLHISLVAGLFFFLGRWLWSRSARLLLWWPAQKAAALFAVAGATYYSFLAGFSIPTQRSMIMIAVAMLAIIWMRKQSPSGILAFALLLVLLWDPLAPLSVSFWLSFLAVAILIYGMAGRVGQSGMWWKWGRAQWLLSLGLLPFLLFYFQQASLISPLANLIAVPWVSFVVVPLSLLAATFSMISAAIADPLFQLADTTFQIIWVMLAWMADLSWAKWVKPQLPLWVTLAAIIGVVLLMAPRGFPLRSLGVIWLLPLFLIESDRPQRGELWFTLLDVGQGLAAVVRTENHVLLYDTGPKYGDDFDAGRAVVVPYLANHLGVDRVDKLIVGHGDADHIGGASSVLSALRIEEVITSAPQQLTAFHPRECHAGEAWEWDGVRFEMIHPPAEYQSSENNRSCVLRIDTPTSSVLVTGDIEAHAEAYLVKEASEKLDADVLVVPHHGSKTSSTSAFIDAVSPRIALFPAGYRNKFGFPIKSVVERYRQRDIKMFDTSRVGAIRLDFSAAGDEIITKTFLDSDRYYWHSME